MNISIKFGENVSNLVILKYLQEPCIITRVTTRPNLNTYILKNSTIISDIIMSHYNGENFDEKLKDFGVCENHIFDTTLNIIIQKNVVDEFLKNIYFYKNLSNDIGIISAGFSDFYLVAQGFLYLTVMGYRVKMFIDYGCDKFTKCMDILPELNKNRINIVIAGMEAVLFTLVSRTSRPYLCVPSENGYGFGSEPKGSAAILGALNSNNSAGIFNIDNIWGSCKFASNYLSQNPSIKNLRSLKYFTIDEDKEIIHLDSVIEEIIESDSQILFIKLSDNGHLATILGSVFPDKCIIATCIHKDFQKETAKSILSSCVNSIAYIPKELLAIEFIKKLQNKDK